MNLGLVGLEPRAVLVPENGGTMHDLSYPECTRVLYESEILGEAVFGALPRKQRIGASATTWVRSSNWRLSPRLGYDRSCTNTVCHWTRRWTSQSWTWR